MTVQSSVSTATTDNTIGATGALAGDRKKKAAAFMVIAFGAFLVWGTTYANPLTLHNAAHDSRHAFGFPCH